MAATPSIPTVQIGPLPASAYWIDLLMDAVEVGLSADERKQPEIATALEFLKKDRTAQRIRSGVTRPEGGWSEVTRHLAVLLLRPSWLPMHGDPISVTDFGEALKKQLLRLERFAASTTISPNLGSVMTRAILRPLIILIAIQFGRSASRRPPEPLQFKPWRPEAGVGRVINDLRIQIRPKTPPEKFHEKLGLSRRSWMRLVTGEIPSLVGFNFTALAAVAAETDHARVQIEAAARRAFAGARAVNRLEQEIQVGDNPQAFWRDCWTEFERVFLIAQNQQTRIDITGDQGRGIAEIRLAAQKDASGVWVHAHPEIGPEVSNIDLIKSLLLAFSSIGIQGDTERIEAALCEALDLMKKSPETKVCLEAITAPTPDAALRLLKKLPESPSTLAGIGAAYAKQGKVAEARAAYDKAFGLAPDQWLNRYGYAIFEARYGDARRALHLLEDSSLSIHHEYPTVLAEAHLKLGRHQEALTACEEAIRRQDSLVAAHYMAAECCRALGLRNEAKAHEKDWGRLRENEHPA